MEKFSVEVFGIKDQVADGGCDCGGVCGPQKTIGEIYIEFSEFIKTSDVSDKMTHGYSEYKIPIYSFWK